MPTIASPDIHYVMDSAFELLEMTPDVHNASFFANLNLNNYFDMYDVGYSTEGACSSMKNLSTMMYEWMDDQDPLTQGVLLSTNVYTSNMQFNEFVGSVTNILVRNYLNNNGIEEKIDSMFFTMARERNVVNIVNESDILFPANIATVIMQENRLYEYMVNIKDRLKLSMNVTATSDELRKHHMTMLTKSIEGTNMVLTDGNRIIDRDELVTRAVENERVSSARKAIKKGVKKFSNLFGKKNITSFVNGDGFTVQGEKYNWHFRQKRSVSLINMTHSPLKGHIPYELSLMNKDNVVMADCCVFVAENTPIIDQIITIVLHIQNDEDQLLAHCNLFNVRPTMDDGILYHNRPKESTSTSAQSTALAISEYTTESNRLNAFYKQHVKDCVADVIGIERKFFNYLLANKRSPIMEHNSCPSYINVQTPNEVSRFYIDEFKNTQNLLT
jgi:hypothetical protein